MSRRCDAGRDLDPARTDGPLSGDEISDDGANGPRAVRVVSTSLPILVSSELHPLGGIPDVAQVHGIAERVLVKLGHAVQALLPAPQLVHVRLERPPPQAPALLLQIADSVVEPLSRLSVRHVHGGEQADPMKVDARPDGRQGLLDDIA